ncbi:hypothetical protein A1O3_09133 [Capronia epimyces CBS 606.96]|uniref:Uncharacterized protein n=1 Tax=Capronia epimyces CBS 606.96 TaxID=1182542 RepID=W9Y6C8_9EURO|nr:uncharacterized protein A1O3_09133 [Capronia epimyces CBS 606.96]EXJ77974.1 hypothetical protein A1O3_09133 [Capronia epimyces CBS 606.96]
MPYTKGTWDTGEQIREHKLAYSIINLHGTEDAVFDERNLDLLKRFTDNVSTTTRDEILADYGWVDRPDDRPGQKAVTKSGSLVGMLIARYGTREPALDEHDWKLLAGWMGQGMPVGQHVQR